VGEDLLLNEEGGTIFSIGIPGLGTVRKNLFEVPLSDIEYEETDWTFAYQETFNWETLLGDDTVTMFGDFGALFSIEAKTLAQAMVIIMFMVIAVVMAIAGAGSMAVILAVPMLLIGALLGLFPIVVLGVAASLVALLIVWKFWLRST